jgi:hypothetical protein
MRTVLAIAVLAAAAAAHAQRPTGADDPTIHCLRSLSERAELAPLAAKIGDLNNAHRQTLPQLADPSKPTEDEKALISLWGTERMTCLDRGRQFRAQYAPPAFAQAFEGGQQRFITLLARLYSGELTYGQFNQARNESATQMAAQFQQAAQGLNDLARAEQAQRQAEAQAQFQSGLQLLQMARPQPVPMPNLMQPSVNCISRPTLGGVQTTCN